MKTQDLNVSGVYALAHPETNQIRYVGQSKNIKRRYRGHVTCSRKSNYPVSMWINKLKDQGIKPKIIVLEEHERPAEIEAAWIEKLREEGCDLLNIHAGGDAPASIGNGRTTKIWSVEGMTTPWLFLCRSLYTYRKTNKGIQKRFKEMKLDRASRKSEFDILQFELMCAQILLNNYGKDSKQVNFAEKWILSVVDKVNSKYPNTMQVMSPCGKRIA